MALSWLVQGLLLALGLAVVLIGLRFLIALARGEEAREALDITGRWTVGLLGGAFAVGGMGLVELGDIVGMLTVFVGSHPFAVSNGLITGLGAGLAAGVLELGPQQFVGVAIAIIGVTLLVYEVSSA